MAKLFIEDTSLTAIGDAIRSKTGGTDKLSPAAMVTAISEIETGSGSGSADIPADALLLSDDCSYNFCGTQWDWFIRQYGDQIATANMQSAEKMFYKSEIDIEIPFDFNFDSSHSANCNYMFSHMYFCPSIGGAINNLKCSFAGSMFSNNRMLRYLPEFVNCNFSECENLGLMFNSCYSLRSLPEGFIAQFASTYAHTYSSSAYTFPYSTFSSCYVLDEIVDFPVVVTEGMVYDNMFNNTFNNCHRVKDILFETESDGTPKTADWAFQVIDLTQSVGYVTTTNKGRITDYNSGLTTDTEVQYPFESEEKSLDALKDNPDWWTSSSLHARYDLNSAIRTLNTLPDTAAFVESMGSGANEIWFDMNQGGYNGGYISEIPSDVIASAAARGWTVVFG